MKKLFIYILIPLIVGGIVALIMMPFNNYEHLYMPPLSPPAIIFPIVWTILYILMGISSYIINKQGGSLKTYYIQLFVNAIWSIIFFVLKWYLVSVIWIIILLILIIRMIKEFKQINKIAAYLQIPYLIWTLFATYLNFGIFILN
jgi:tryptophan-rich sensory protein